MKMRIAMALFLGACCMSVSHGWAQEEKKTDEKKAEEKKTEESKDLVVNGELVAADLKDKVRMASFCKTYPYKMIEGRVYQIDVKSTWDNYLRLENPAGEQVAADDDGGGFPNARITYRAPKTGDYTVIVTSYDGGATGKFTLTVKDTSAPGLKKLAVKPGEAIDLKLVKGQAAVVTELTKDDTLFQQKIHKLFHFEAEEGKSYQIDHMSAAFDAYLYLEDPNGNILAKDDDGGEGFNSRINFKAAKAGKYRILATSLGGKSTGAFTLKVQQTDGVPKEEKKDLKLDGVRRNAIPVPPALRIERDVRVLTARVRD